MILDRSISPRYREAYTDRHGSGNVFAADFLGAGASKVLGVSGGLLLWHSRHQRREFLAAVARHQGSGFLREQA
jgi:hypothetical protein